MFKIINPLIAFTALSILTTACGLSSPYQKALDVQRALANQRIAQPQPTTNGPGATVVGGAVSGKDPVPKQKASWSAVKIGLPGATQTLVIDPQVPSTLYAGMKGGGGVFKSTNGGANWTAVNTGLTTPAFFNATVQALAIDPQVTSTVYAATDKGIFKSMNGGANWTEISRGASWNALTPGRTGQDSHALVLDPKIPSTLYVGAIRGVFKSTDGGATWREANTWLTEPLNEIENVASIDVLVINPLVPSTLYAMSKTGKVFKSMNGGENWRALTINLGVMHPLHVSSLAIDPQVPSTLYAGMKNGDGVFKSTNSGASWSAVYDDLGENNIVQGLAIDPQAPSTVYAGTSYGSFKSTDSGANWTGFSIGFHALAFDPQATSTVYAVTGNEIFKSTNGGDN